MMAISHEPPISARKPKNPPTTRHSAPLSPMNRCTVRPPGRPARSSRRAIASRRLRRIPGARRGPRLAASRSISRRSSEPPLLGGLHAGARGEPVDRPAVEQQRHGQQRDREARGGQRARQQRRHTSTFVVARISTKATVHSTPATPRASSPAGEEVISRITPGVRTFISTIATMPMPATM